MKRFLLLSLYFLIIFAVSCTVDDKVKITEESDGEEPEDPEIPVIDEPEEPVIEEPAPVVDENKPEDYIMELKPIKQFSNYVVAPNAVYGIDGISLEKIEPVDIDDTVLSFNDFFLLGGDVYFSVENTNAENNDVIHYFKQSEADISDIGASNFPVPLASEHIEFEGNDFKIETTPYDIDDVPTPTSRVYQGLLVVGYLKIDGCVLIENGLWFSVAETIKTRYEGVYLWTIGGSSPNRILESGRIY